VKKTKRKKRWKKTILAKHEILDRIARDKLVEGYVNLKQQLQPASFDLTLESIHALEEKGALDFDNTARTIPKTRKLEFDEKNWVDLKPGAYKIRFNETIHLPDDLTALSVSRSSLARCGAFTHAGWWDPGYHGRGEALLTISGKGLRLKKNARVAQMIFLKLNDKARELYAGIHNKENI